MKTLPFLLRGLCTAALLSSLAACGGGGNGNGNGTAAVPTTPPASGSPDGSPAVPDPTVPDADQPAPQLKCAP